MSYLNFTKQHIFNAFDELLSEIPFDKITVQMIIDRSGVSKSTLRLFLAIFLLLFL